LIGYNAISAVLYAQLEFSTTGPDPNPPNAFSLGDLLLSRGVGFGQCVPDPYRLLDEDIQVLSAAAVVGNRHV
jgi:hypothetical protein